MVQAIAIDDEQMALDVIKTYCSKLPNVTLRKTFVNPFKAIEYLKSHDIDVVLLDINMPDLSGLSLAETLPQTVNVVFTTAYREHAVTSYDLEATDFLAKPFSLVRFIKAIEKIERQKPDSIDNDKRAFILLKSGYEQYKIDYDDILYVVSAGNYMEFVTGTEKVLSRLTMTEAEQLLAGNDFLRVHKSYLISIRHLKRIMNNKILINGTEIPIGQSYREKLFDKLESIGK
ncbi:MAG: LytTR family DNA-binding domain-containing protein [Cyclobacteriaceae bacterium]